MILGPDVTPHRYGPLLPSNQQHLPPPDLISTDAAPPTPQPEMKYKVPKRTALSRHFQVSKQQYSVTPAQPAFPALKEMPQLSSTEKARH